MSLKDGRPESPRLTSGTTRFEVDGVARHQRGDPLVLGHVLGGVDGTQDGQEHSVGKEEPRLLVGAPERRAMAIGIWGGISGLGIASIPLIYLGLIESRGKKRPIDLPGVLLAGGGVLFGIWGIVDGNDRGWGSAHIIMVVTAVALLAAFVVRQALAAHPHVPLRLFRNRSFAMANITGILFTSGVFGSVFLLVQFLQIGQGHSPLAAGLRTLPWTAAPLVVAPIAGYLTGRIGVRPLIVAGLGMQAVALAAMAVSIGTDPAGFPTGIVPGLVVGAAVVAVAAVSALFFRSETRQDA